VAGIRKRCTIAISTLNNAGILFVAASGNEGDDNDADPHYPSGYDLPNVISVAAVDQNGNLANFSNYGQFSVDVAAPGVNILSTIPGNKYATFSGTSMATPHVSGVLALLASYDPTLSASALKTRLLESGTSLASLGGVTYSSRLVSAHRALANLTAPVADPGNVQDFNYGITKIPFTTNTAVENEAIFQQADELNYKDIELPFTFPFYGKSTTESHRFTEWCTVSGCRAEFPWIINPERKRRKMQLR
jgi:subtilisin family serine protease